MVKFVALSAVLAGLLVNPALGDEKEGTVQAFDRMDRILVLTDKTVWEIPGTIDVPADLARGDRVHLDYDSAGEDGITAITSMTRLTVATPVGSDG